MSEYALCFLLEAGGPERAPAPATGHARARARARRSLPCLNFLARAYGTPEKNFGIVGIGWDPMVGWGIRRAYAKQD